MLRPQMEPQAKASMLGTLKLWQLHLLVVLDDHRKLQLAADSQPV